MVHICGNICVNKTEPKRFEISSELKLLAKVKYLSHPRIKMAKIDESWMYQMKSEVCFYNLDFIVVAVLCFFLWWHSIVLNESKREYFYGVTVTAGLHQFQ